MIIFKSTPQKTFETVEWFQRIFFEGVFKNISESAPKKLFETSRTTSKNFFEGVFINYFQILHPRKHLKQSNDFKEFFRRCIHDSF